MESGNQSSVLSDLLVTHTIGNHLHDSTKWCRFLSIVGIVFLSIFVIAAIIGGPSIVRLVADLFPGLEDAIGNLIIIIMILLIAVSGVLLFLLFRFSILTRRGLELRNQALFNDGLKALKFYFIIYGVIGILGVLVNIAGLFSL